MDKVEMIECVDKLIKSERTKVWKEVEMMFTIWKDKKKFEYYIETNGLSNAIEIFENAVYEQIKNVS